MKLYIAYNGYTGNGEVSCVIIAEDEEHAIKLAVEKYKEEVENCKYYDEDYYANVTVVLMCEDTSKEFKGPISD